MPIKPQVLNVTAYCCNSILKPQRYEPTDLNALKNNFTGVKLIMDTKTWSTNFVQFNFGRNGITIYNSRVLLNLYLSNITMIHAVNDMLPGSRNTTIITGIKKVASSKVTFTSYKYIHETYVRTDLGGVVVFKGPQNRVNYTYSLLFAEIPKEYASYREVSITHRCARLDIASKNWTVSGCVDQIVNDTLVSCSCETERSLLFGIQVHAKLLNWTNDQKLLIVIVPPILGASCILITMTLVVLFAFRNRTKTRRTFIQIGICASFLGQGIMSLLSVWILSLHPMPTVLCETIAYLKLYFALTSALWVFMEGAVLFIKLKKAMAYSKLLSKRNLTVVSFLIWTCPLILIVGMGLWEQRKGNEILLDVAQPYTSTFNRNLEIRKRYPNATLLSIDAFSKYKLCCPSYDSCTFVVVFSLIVVVCCCSIVISLYVARMVWQKSKMNASDKHAYFQRFKATAGAAACLTCCLGFPQFTALILYKSRLVERIYSTLILANVITLFEGPFVLTFYYFRNTALRRQIEIWRRQSKQLETSKTSFSM